jgi:hypothetical protein
MLLPKNVRGDNLDTSSEEAIDGEHDWGQDAHIRHLVVVVCLETTDEGQHVTLRVLEPALEASLSSFGTIDGVIPKVQMMVSPGGHVEVPVHEPSADKVTIKDALVCLWTVV